MSSWINAPLPSKVVTLTSSPRGRTKRKIIRCPTKCVKGSFRWRSTRASPFIRHARFSNSSTPRQSKLWTCTSRQVRSFGPMESANRNRQWICPMTKMSTKSKRNCSQPPFKKYSPKILRRPFLCLTLPKHPRGWHRPFKKLTQQRTMKMASKKL